MFKKLFVVYVSLTILACSKIDMAKLSNSDRDIVEFTHQMIGRVGFGGDVALRSIFGKESIEQKSNYTYYVTSFGAKRGFRAVHDEFNKYCRSLGGEVRQTACLINGDTSKIKYYYQLFASYNKHSGGKTSMLLKMYIPKTIGDKSYINVIRQSGYKTDSDLEAEKFAAMEKKKLRTIELANMTKKGTKVCKANFGYVIGWVEGAANEKIQIRLLSNNQVIWDNPNNWRICG